MQNNERIINFGDICPTLIAVLLIHERKIQFRLIVMKKGGGEAKTNFFFLISTVPTNFVRSYTNGNKIRKRKL